LTLAALKLRLWLVLLLLARLLALLLLPRLPVGLVWMRRLVA
jgi:hypothetical protein